MTTTLEKTPTRVIAPSKGERAYDEGHAKREIESVIAYDRERNRWLVDDECGDTFEVSGPDGLDEGSGIWRGARMWEYCGRVECSHADWESGAGVRRWLDAPVTSVAPVRALTVAEKLREAATSAELALKWHVEGCNDCRGVDLDNCNPQSFCHRGRAIYVMAFDLDAVTREEMEAV